MAKPCVPTACVLCGVVKECRYTGRCRACYKRLYYTQNREKVLASVRAYTALDPDRHRRWRKASWYRKRYGLELSQLKSMFDQQNGRCAVCDKDLKPWSATTGAGGNHVDHCHRTGKVRGVLCQKCNMLLGCAMDTPATLKRAVVYLEKHFE